MLPIAKLYLESKLKPEVKKNLPLHLVYHKHVIKPKLLHTTARQMWLPSSTKNRNQSYVRLPKAAETEEKDALRCSRGMYFKQI